MASGTDGFTFGPYYSAAAARHHLLMFQSRAFPGQGSENWGIVWSENGRACVLQPPAYDQDGDALALAYEWTGPVPARPTPAKPEKTSKQPIKSILEEFYTNSVWTTSPSFCTRPNTPSMLEDITASPLPEDCKPIHRFIYRQTWYGQRLGNGVSGVIFREIGRRKLSYSNLYIACCREPSTH